MCDRDAKGAPSIFKVIRSAAALLFSTDINLEFRLQNAGEVRDAMQLGSLLATLKTYEV